MKIIHYLKDSKVYDFVFGLLCFFSVFGSSLVNGLLAFLVILYSVSFNKNSKQQLFSLIKSPFIFLLIFLIYIYFEGLIVGVLHEKRFQLLYLIPLLLILGSKVKSIFRVGIFFVSANLVLILIGLFRITNAYFNHANFNLKEGELVNDLMLLERPYLGFVCVLSVVISMYLMRNATKFKMLYLLCVVIFSSYIVFISARLALISLIVILITYFIGYSKLNWKFKGLSFLLIFFSFLAFNFINPTLADRFLIFSNIDFQTEQIKDYEPRVIIWQCASEIIRKGDYNLLFGMVSTEELSDKLVACYQTDEGNLVRRQFFVESKFNTHNQYLDLFITTGFFGVFILAVFGIGLIYKNYKNFFVVGFALALGMFLLTENGLYRQMGVYLISIVFVFVHHFKNLNRVNTN